MTLYCRRCDLTFCERHQHVHETLDPESEHATSTDVPEGAVDCSVCAGIVREGA